MSNFEKIHHYFKSYESPSHFIDWAFLYSISSCLGRKVWFQGGEPLYANQQIIIVGDPGLGKSLPTRRLCDTVQSLTRIDPVKGAVPLVNIAPDCVTLEKLYDVLEKCGTAVRIKNPKTEKMDPYFHSSISFVLADEMGLLFKNSDKIKDLTKFLNAGYDCKEKFEYETKRSGQNRISKLCVNFFGCCTPNWVAENVSNSIIDDGWSSRVIWIFGAEKRQLTTFFKFTDEQHKALEDVKDHWRAIALLGGEVHMTPECMDFYDRWYQKDPAKNRLNNDSKLDGYYARKRAHAIKVALACHFAEKTTMVLELEDFQKALTLLGHAEMDMHRALASVNVNPTARLASDIQRHFITLGEEGSMTLAEVAGMFYNRVPNGLVAVEEAVRFLTMTDVIKMHGGGRYFMTKKIVPVEFTPKTQTTNELKEELLKEAKL